MNGRVIKLPTPEEIAICAYLIWENEGRPQGRDAAHWLQAEKQLHAVCLHENGKSVKPAPARSIRRTTPAVAPVQELQGAAA